MRALFIARKVPFPLDTGTNQRVYHLLKALSEISDVTLVIPAKGPALSDELEALRPLYQNARTFPVEWLNWCRDRALGRPLGTLKSRLRQFHPTQPALLQAYGSPRAAAFVRELCRERFDVIWAERIASIPLLHPDLAPRIFVDLDDLEHRKLHRHLMISGFSPSQWFDYFELSRLRRTEKRLARTSYEIVVCSATDRAALGGGARVHVIQNGTDVSAAPPGDRENEGVPHFLFVGTMSYLPNVDAVTHFAERVFPLVLGALPGARFFIVGRDPDAAVQRLHDGDRVVVTGTVASVEPYLRACTAVVAPIRFGGGTRIKILEAMGYGKPVVATTIGAEGLLVESERHLLIADSPQDFARQCVRVAQDRALRAKLTANAFDRVRTEYSWSAIERAVRELVAPGRKPVVRALESVWT